MTNDQLEGRTLAFVNTILADIDLPPVTALNAGLVGRAGSCVIALTLNLTAGVFPARFSTYEGYVDAMTNGTPEFPDDDIVKLTWLRDNIFTVDEGVSTYRDGGRHWPIPAAVTEFIRRFDEDQMPHLVMGEIVNPPKKA